MCDIMATWQAEVVACAEAWGRGGGRWTWGLPDSCTWLQNRLCGAMMGRGSGKVSGRWIVRSQSPGCYPIGSGKYRQGFVSRWVTDL